MLIVHHSKDMDGYASGAILKHVFPEARLLGWDYKDRIPLWEFRKNEEAIIIDVSFPIQIMINISEFIGRKMTWVDHHSKAKEGYDNCKDPLKEHINYVYDEKKAACELAWDHYMPGMLPKGIQLISKYDTWVKDNDWETKTVPFQFYLNSICNSAETFPMHKFTNGLVKAEEFVKKAILVGEGIQKYQETQDEKAARRASFETNFFGFRAICMNSRFFSSDTLKSVYDPEQHDIMLGFEYTGKMWTTSLRTFKDDIDVSEIAMHFGGGGHKKAAGFETKTFDEIFY